MEIRFMQESDVEQVGALEREIFSKPWSEKDFRDVLQKDDCIYFVAAEENIILGYCGMWCVVGEGQITNVAVDPKYRKKQVGTKLLQAVLEEGQRRGNTEFTLEVRVSNHSAIALYQKFQFENVGIRRKFYEEPTEDAVIMWKK